MLLLTFSGLCRKSISISFFRSGFNYLLFSFGPCTPQRTRNLSTFPYVLMVTERTDLGYPETCTVGTIV